MHASSMPMPNVCPLYLIGQEKGDWKYPTCFFYDAGTLAFLSDKLQWISVKGRIRRIEGQQADSNKALRPQAETRGT